MFRGNAVAVLIVAAGQSRRMQGRDKIFAPLADAPLLAHTVEAFLNSPLVDEIVIVLRKETLANGQQLAESRGWPPEVHFCIGGQRRQDSVYRGLAAVNKRGWVMIHDGARPLVRPALIERGLQAAQSSGAAVPGIPVADTIKLVSESGSIEQTLPRDRLRAIQTPQIFLFDLIWEAHSRYSDSEQLFTDDAAMLEAVGHDVQVFAGDPDNIKVTRPQDFGRIASRYTDEEAHHE